MFAVFGMRPAQARGHEMALGWYLAAWLCVMVAFVALRLPAKDMLNGDEQIPIALSKVMSERGSLDPNWRFAELPEHLKYDQYNFYLYNIVAHAILQVGAWLRVPDLIALRWANVLFQTAAALLLAHALRRLGVSRPWVAVAAAMIAVAPGLVQDAGMARPESLLCLLTAALVWVTTLPFPVALRSLLFGLALGAGITIKVTFVASIVLGGVPYLFAHRHDRVKDHAVVALALLFGISAGFATAAPYILMHPDVYISGLKVLATQYATGHPPHSRPEYSVLGQGGWIARYLTELYGLAPLAALAAVALCKGRLRAYAIAFALGYVISFTYFAFQRVFFERNLAHVLVPMLAGAALCVASLKPAAARIAASLVLLLPMLYWSVQVAHALRHRGGQLGFEAARQMRDVQYIDWQRVYAGQMPPGCRLIAYLDFRDPWSERYAAALERNGYAPAARYRGYFSFLVTSTLHTNLGSDVRYFRCPE